MTDQERLTTLINSNQVLAMSNQDLAHTTKELVAINKESILLARLNYRLLEICGSISSSLSEINNRNPLEESWYEAINKALAKKEL